MYFQLLIRHIFSAYWPLKNTKISHLQSFNSHSLTTINPTKIHYFQPVFFKTLSSIHESYAEPRETATVQLPYAVTSEPSEVGIAQSVNMTNEIDSETRIGNVGVRITYILKK